MARDDRPDPPRTEPPAGLSPRGLRAQLSSSLGLEPRGRGEAGDRRREPSLGEPPPDVCIRKDRTIGGCCA